jgi:hypothetical protein
MYEDLRNILPSISKTALSFFAICITTGNDEMSDWLVLVQGISSILTCLSNLGLGITGVINIEVKRPSGDDDLIAT